jgi:formate-dependent nitrite reductase membrane component NrfD
MQTAGVLLVVLGVAIGALTLLMTALPSWPGSMNDPSTTELWVFGGVAAACFVAGLALLVI